MVSSDFFLTHPVFTLEEYAAFRAREGSSNPRTVGNLLADQVKGGRVVRVHRGVYANVPPAADPAAFAVDPFLVAGRLAADAVVAYHAALQFRGKAYSVWSRFSFLTRARRQPFTFRGMEFKAVQAPLALRDRADMGGGIIMETNAGTTVRVTSFERTLVDVLDAPAHGGGWEEVWRSLEMVEFFDLDEVIRMAIDRDSALTAARVGFYLDQHREPLMVEEKHLAALRAHAPRQPRHLDRQRESGRLVKAWNLVVPERVLARAWEEVP